MQLHVSPADGVPIYLQIVNQVKYLVSSARLAAGEELPPIRTLAVVEKRRTTGTYVSGGASPLARRERLKILGRRVDALLADARQMDVSLDDVLDLVRQRDRAMASS